MKLKLRTTQTFALLSLLLLCSFDAWAESVLCQHKITQKITQRSVCKRSERQIYAVPKKELVFTGRTTAQLGPEGAIQYLAPSGAADPIGSPERAQMPVPVACQVYSLLVKLDTAPGQGQERDFLTVVNGVSEGISCSINDTATSCTVNPLKSLNAGDSVSFESYPSLNPARSYAEYTWKCEVSE